MACKSSTVRMANVKVQFEDAVALVWARSARLPTRASATEGRLVRATSDASARSRER